MALILCGCSIHACQHTNCQLYAYTKSTIPSWEKQLRDCYSNTSMTRRYICDTQLMCKDNHESLVCQLMSDFPSQRQPFLFSWHYKVICLVHSSGGLIDKKVKFNTNRMISLYRDCSSPHTMAHLDAWVVPAMWVMKIELNSLLQRNIQCWSSLLLCATSGCFCSSLQGLYWTPKSAEIRGTCRGNIMNSWQWICSNRYSPCYWVTLLEPSWVRMYSWRPNNWK